MLRVGARICAPKRQAPIVLQVVHNSGSHHHEFNPGRAPKVGYMTDEQMDKYYLDLFNRKDIDGWELRQGLNELQGYDMVPEPVIIIAAMKACRRVNDLAVAIRYLEALQFKCGGSKDKIWPYLLQEVKPTLTELGIPTPEEIGYDKPELACEDPDHMH